MIATWPAVLSLLIAGQVEAAATHCTASEQVIFSCPVGAKIASICASEDLTPKRGTIQYRFGPEGRPELAYPPSGTSRDQLGAGQWTFAGGGGAWLAIHKPPYRYVIYTAMGRGWAAKAGVAVEENGRLVANLACKSTPVSRIGPDLFAHAGIPDDPAPFELP